MNGRTAKDYADSEMRRKYAKSEGTQKGRTLSQYDRLKRRIEKEFTKKKLVGDIAISDEEFAVLIEYMQYYYRYANIYKSSTCVDVLICVAMVQIGIRYYDGAYWPHFAKLLNKDAWKVNHQTFMGAVCIDTLNKYDKCVCGESERVETILMHGFVANKYAYKLMDFLYAYYKIDLDRDLSRNDREMMKELVNSIKNKDNSNRTYILVQQTSDAVLYNQRGGNTRLRWLLKLIDATFWDEEVRFNPKNRLSVLFNEWANQSQDIKKSRGIQGDRQKIFSSPHIIFRSDTSKFYVRLPAQIVRTNYDVAWHCIMGEHEHIVQMEALESVLAYKTESIEIPLSSSDLFSKMSFTLTFGELSKRFSLPAETVRFFSKEGASLGITSIKAGEYYAFSKDSDAITSAALVEKRKHGELWFYYFVLEDGDILKTADGKAVLVARKPEEGLLAKGIVNGATAGEGHLAVYNKVPAVLIKIPERKLAGTAIVVNGYKNKLKEKCEITEIDLKDGTDNVGYWFSLTDVGCDHDGDYEIIVDVPGDRSVRNWKFALLQDFGYSFDDSPYIFATKGSVKISANPRDKVLPINEEVRPDEEPGYYNFELSSARRELDFWIGSSHVQIVIPQFEYSFDNVEWNIQKHNEIWHTELPRKIWVRVPANRISFEMDNGEVSDEYYIQSYDRRASDDVIECDLTRFRSWINHANINNIILLKACNKTIPFLEVVGGSRVVSALPMADFDKQRIVLEFEIIGRSEYYVDLWYEKERIAEKVPLSGSRAEIECKIHSGKYLIELFESEEDDFGFDEPAFISIYKETRVIINPRDLTGRTVEILSIRKDEHDMFKKWLSHQYTIYGLKALDHDGYSYKGLLVDQQGKGTPIDVIFEPIDLDNLRFAFINWVDHDYDDEETEFLYDGYEKSLVCHEKKGLRPREQYRRYECVFSDDYMYEIKIVK